MELADKFKATVNVLSKFSYVNDSMNIMTKEIEGRKNNQMEFLELILKFSIIEKYIPEVEMS